MREYAFLNKGLEIVIRDERPTAGDSSTPSRTTPWPPRSTSPGRRHQARRRGGLERVFKYDLGLVDYVAHLNRSKTPANPTIISFEADAPRGPVST